MRSFTRVLTFGLCLIGTASPVYAGSVNAYLYGTSGQTVKTNEANSGSPTNTYNYSGFLKWSLDTKNYASASQTTDAAAPALPTLFYSFCIQFSQNVFLPGYSNFATTTSNIQTAPIGNGDPAMGSYKAAALSRLFNIAYDPTNFTAAQASAFQLAVWEIVYDFNKPGNAQTTLAGGKFQADSSSTGYSQASTWLSQVAGTTTENFSYTLVALESSSLQDQIVAVDNGKNPNNTPPAPEPASAALFVVGTLGFVGVRIRRRFGKA